MIENIFDQLERDEGYREYPYKDTEGNWTIGVGHNLEDDHLTDEELAELQQTGWTEDQIYEALKTDVAKVDSALVNDLPFFSSLDEVRQGVLLNMGFNMGVADLLEFHHMLTAVAGGDYNTAADQILDSKFGKQLPSRADRLAIQMRTDVWQ